MRRKLARWPEERLKGFLRDQGIDIERTQSFTISWHAEGVVYIEATLIAAEPEDDAPIAGESIRVTDCKGDVTIIGGDA